MILEWERPNYNKNPKALKEMNEKPDYKKKKKFKVLLGKPTLTKPMNWEKKFATHVIEEESVLQFRWAPTDQ